MENIYY